MISQLSFSCVWCIRIDFFRLSYKMRIQYSILHFMFVSQWNYGLSFYKMWGHHQTCMGIFVNLCYCSHSLLNHLRVILMGWSTPLSQGEIISCGFLLPILYETLSFANCSSALNICSNCIFKCSLNHFLMSYWSTGEMERLAYQRKEFLEDYIGIARLIKGENGTGWTQWVT